MKRFLLVLLTIGILLSCDNEELGSSILSESPNTSNPTDPPTTGQTPDDSIFQENFGQNITANFLGTVKDVNGNQLEGVQIQIGTSNAVTDANGVFVIESVSVYEQFAYVKAFKEGFISGSRALIPIPTGFNDIQITLLEKNTTGSVNSGEESEVTLGNSKVSFAGDFIDSQGNTYNGQVEVSMHYVAPNTTETFKNMPGMLLAQRADNSAVSLETYGMLAVNLYSPSGEQLNIAENTTATIEFPVDASQTAFAPSEIPLWYFDETVGYWKEQGSATRIGNTYVGEVSHFSWWNCDVPRDLVDVCFDVTMETNSGTQILADHYVEIRSSTTNQMIFSGILSSGGRECGFFPLGEAVNIKIYNANCSTDLIYEGIYGPFTTATVFTVVIPLTSDIVSTTLIGQATDCTGGPLNGYLYLIDNFSDFSIIPITNGVINQSLSSCATSYTYLVVDSATGEQSNQANFVPVDGITDLGTISTCSQGGGSTYEGDVILLTQAEVDAFGAFGYGTINGDLSIGQLYTTSDITDLSPLIQLQEVTGSLSITYLESLTSLNGLSNVHTASEGFAVQSMALLTDLTGMSSLQNTSSFAIHMSNSIVSLNGIGNITTLERWNMDSNPQLQDITALSNLTTINDQLFFVGNNSLTNLNGLENLTTCNTLQIWDSDLLDDFCAIEDLINNGTYGGYSVFGNLYNPTEQDIIDGNCSL
jgi:hypothetical protein